jgi:CheY-like chemotaxis protein
MRHQSPVALVVSSDRQVRQLIVASLDELGCTTLDAASDKQGLEFAAITRVDCVIIDACPPETLVSNMIRQLRLLQPEIRVLYLVDRAGAAPGPWSVLRRTDTCLNKPFELTELCRIVESWCNGSLAFENVAGMSMN